MGSGNQDFPRLAVVGHLVYDRIVFPDGRTTEAPGGISYNVAALAAMMRSGRLFPVCDVGRDIEDIVIRAFGSSKIFDRSAVRITDLPNVVNTLVYDRAGERQEWNSRRPDPLSLQRVPGDVEAVLLNFISGDDVLLDDLRAFRERFDGLIFCDFHSLALGRSEDGKRFLRRHPLWREYVSQANIVQMNLAEFSSIVEQTEKDIPGVSSRMTVLHSAGPQTAIITLGRDGFLMSMDAGKRIYHIHAVAVPNEIDSTGCGDTLAAAILYDFVISGDLLEAAVRANLFAAAKATFSGIDGFRDIDGIISGLAPWRGPTRLA